jgi:predicted nucleic acid-binding protein
VITLSEVLTLPFKKNRIDLVEKYRNFILYPVDAVIAEKAAELRAQYSLKTPDAMQLAVGIENCATLFLTNDSALKICKEIEVVALADFV